jgi:hypothetical protein
MLGRQFNGSGIPITVLLCLQKTSSISRVSQSILSKESTPRR